jgi:hypothetical protein
MARKLFGAEVPAPPDATKLGGTTEATLARLLSASHRSFAAQYQSVINFMLVEARVHFRKQFVNE